MLCLSSTSHGRHRESFGQGDVVGCFLDVAKGMVGFSKNGRYLGDAFTLDPPAAAAALFPALVLKQGRVRIGGFPLSPFSSSTATGMI